MKHTIQAGVVSPFPMYIDPAAVEFDTVQARAIEAVYAAGGAALWNGAALSFELDQVKAAALRAKFDEAWQASKIMAEILADQAAAEAQQRKTLATLVKAATTPIRKRGASV